MASIEERVQNLIEKKIVDLGYELYDVQYGKEGKDYFLRIYIDKPQGIGLTDCETVNDAISDLLDEANYIKEAYFLEVSSPGIERILRKEKHFKDNMGNVVDVKLFKPMDGKKEYQGILKSFNEETVEIIEQETEKSIALDRKNISLVKLHYDWDEKGGN